MAKINLTCKQCNKIYQVIPSKQKSRFCSPTCWYNWNKKEHHPLYNKPNMLLKERHKNLGHPMVGKKHTQLSRKKMSNSKKGKLFSKIHKQKISEKLKGKNNHFWKGGVTKLNDLIRNSSEYKLWRSKVFERDGWTCQTCKKKGTYLEAHHKKSLSLLIKEFSITNLNEAIVCKELWDIDNGVTLCDECHTLTIPNKNRYVLSKKTIISKLNNLKMGYRDKERSEKLK